eukprot:4932739-Karenia_brevis.AAC.1
MGTSTYPAGNDRRCAAVGRRADALPAEHLAKARVLDRRFCGTVEGQVGAVEQRLAAYGPVRGLVFGHYAEASEH